MTRPLAGRDATTTPRRASGDDDDAKSVAQALRAVLLFLALAAFVAWTGIAAGTTRNPSPAGGPSTQGEAGQR